MDQGAPALARPEPWWKGQLFSVPPKAPRLIGTQTHKEQLSEFLESDTVSALHIVGIIGVGKAWIARWLAQHTQDTGNPVAWIGCRQKSVTVESLLV